MLKQRILLITVLLALTSVIIILSALATNPATAESVLTDSMATSSTAHVVVQFSPGDLTIQPITFTTPISGLLALQKTGLSIVTLETAYGTAVCSINGVGCPADNCWCTDKYWGYDYWDGSAWQGHPTGADNSIVSDGNVEGWHYGEYLQDPLPPALPLLAASKALNYLRPFQEATTGGFGSYSDSAEMLLTIGANHEMAANWRVISTAPSLQQYWFKNSPAFSRNRVENSGKLAAGLAATGSCWPPNTRRPGEFYNPATGAYSPYSGFQAWAMLGVKALGQPIPAEARAYLAGLVMPNGGWEWNTGFGTDTNTTALAIQALISAGEPTDSPIITNALNYLKSAQNTDGGLMYDPQSTWPTGNLSDADSTSYVIQAIYAAGQNPLTGTWVISDTNPVEYLLSLQLPDGSFKWQSGDASANVKSTQHAVPALLGTFFPQAINAVLDCSGGFFPLIYR